MTADSRSSNDFPEFFEAVTGREPFEWQADLADELCEGRLPNIIDVPTGFGKTSVILCWAYALAHTPPELEIPRRLFFVVDRRLVVDAAHEDARTLREALTNADPPAPILDVARGLRDLHRDASIDPLEVVRMRGGVTWESRWLARPDQAAVVVGTVDQFGSRLLFRGYGVSDRMRPIDAALVGTDAWLIIDEAHIAEPLVTTARSVAAYQETQGKEELGGIRMARPLVVTKMSATVEADEHAFRADPDEQRHSTRFPKSAAAAALRLDASKPARLIDLESLATGSPKRRRQLTEHLGQAMADLALQVDSRARVVGVIANTIGAARAAHRRIDSAGEEVCLLIGRSREFERSQILEDYAARLKVGAERSEDQSRLFVVATQTIEVGADFDLDAIVSECAPLSSLIQRFGRVNRVGARPSHESHIVHAGFLHEPDNDLIYGKATSATWSYLEDQGRAASLRSAEDHDDEDLVLDFGLVAARELAENASTSDHSVRPEPPFVPRVLGAHVERWAATSPPPFPDQDVAPFLHGVGQVVPEVAVAWRAAPPLPAAAAASTRHEVATAWQEWLDLVRPVDWEFVSVPIWEARGLLADEPSMLPTSDLEGAATPLEPNEAADVFDRPLGVVYRGPSEPPTVIGRPNDIKPGDRLILDNTLGGHDRWGWTGVRASGRESVPDIADLAPSRKRGSVRIDNSGRVLSSLSTNPDSSVEVKSVVEKLFETIKDKTTDDETAADLDSEAITARLGELLDLPLLPVVSERLRRAIDGWRRRTVSIGRDAGRTSDHPNVVVLLEESPGEPTPMDAISDEDEGSTSSASVPQSLAEHGAEVRELAERLANQLHLDPGIAQTVALAACWHDLGKADERFQIMLHDGDPVAAQAGKPRAKSGRDWRDPVAKRARQLSGVPTGFRHEAVSGRLVRQLMGERPDLTAGVDEELLHHLVVSHHGYARPLLPAIIDSDAPGVSVQVDNHEVVVSGAPQQVDWDHPTRFESLNARYGWWGLARLEALVRLADMECSARPRATENRV